jgi:hypothetical protein
MTELFIRCLGTRQKLACLPLSRNGCTAADSTGLFIDFAGAAHNQVELLPHPPVTLGPPIWLVPPSFTSVAGPLGGGIEHLPTAGIVPTNRVRE